MIPHLEQLPHLHKVANRAVRELNRTKWVHEIGSLKFNVTVAVQPKNAPKGAPDKFFVNIHSAKPLDSKKAAEMAKALKKHADKYHKGFPSFEFEPSQKQQVLWAAGLKADELKTFFKRNGWAKKEPAYTRPYVWIVHATAQQE